MQHGPVGWRHHGCRCDECHAALLAEGKLAWAMRQVRQGRDPATRVPANWPRRRLALLEASGLTRGQIAQLAGVSPSTISRLADPATRRISRITADAIRRLM